MDDDDRRLDALWGVFHLAREMRRHVHELLAGEPLVAAAGFRPPCMGVLDTVARLQPVSQREISDQLGLDASDVVGVLDVLETAGLVERRRDPQDRRRHAVVLTEVGQSAAERFAALQAEAETRALSALDPEERRLLADLLHRATGRSFPGAAGRLSV